MFNTLALTKLTQRVFGRESVTDFEQRFVWGKIKRVLFPILYSHMEQKIKDARLLAVTENWATEHAGKGTELLLNHMQTKYEKDAQKPAPSATLKAHVTIKLGFRIPKKPSKTLRFSVAQALATVLAGSAHWSPSGMTAALLLEELQKQGKPIKLQVTEAGVMISLAKSPIPEA